MVTMSSWALSSLHRVALDLQSFEDGRCPQEAAEVYVLLFELVYQELLTIRWTFFQVCSMISTAIETLQQLVCSGAGGGGAYIHPLAYIRMRYLIALVSGPCL